MGHTYIIIYHLHSWCIVYWSYCNYFFVKQLPPTPKPLPAESWLSRYMTPGLCDADIQTLTPAWRPTGGDVVKFRQEWVETPPNSS